ncbi:hypothetical protein HDU91_004259, partial [Kappamyces sp. JEL0680]
IGRYCTQEDALFGNLTVRETLDFSARFNLPETSTVQERNRVVKDLIEEFGLKDVENTIIGTPLLKGCSGGQVRRVSVASQIVGFEEGILFLDEPTSAYSVIETVKRLGTQKNATILATIHQPSTETFNLFTHVLILAKGETAFFGTREEAILHFAAIGRPIPTHSNPSDVYLQMTNIDFLQDREVGEKSVTQLVEAFKSSKHARAIDDAISASIAAKKEMTVKHRYANGFLHQTKTLIQRGFLNAAKNPLSYWVRVAMYMGLAFLMGTTWLRMGFNQSRVSDRMVSLFFSVAFLSFMSVAGIPAFLEERHVFLRERSNGLYGVESYLISNFLVSVPFLAIIAFSFSILAYFLMGYQQLAANFFIFVGYLFVMLLIAEAQVMFIAVVLPIFVAALTISAFTNGLWMVVDGFALIKISDIPAGWRYTFHYIDFQKYTFEAILKNEMVGLTFQCQPNPASSGCSCMVPGAGNPQCTFSGEDVMSYYEHDDVKFGVWLAILLAILVVLKLGTYAVLKAKGTKS